MPIKPSKETILETYSLKELLDLAKEKDMWDRIKRKEEMERHLTAISGMLTGIEEEEIESRETQYPSKESQTEKIHPTAQVKRERKLEKTPSSKSAEKTVQKSTPKSQSKTAAKSTNNKPLSAMLKDTISRKPMSVDQIMESLKKAGWESKAKNPRTVLFIELGKQVDKGTLKKAGRGMYARS